jgi:hypothetical protein
MLLPAEPRWTVCAATLQAEVELIDRLCRLARWTRLRSFNSQVGCGNSKRRATRGTLQRHLRSRWGDPDRHRSNVPLPSRRNRRFGIRRKMRDIVPTDNSRCSWTPAKRAKPLMHVLGTMSGIWRQFQNSVALLDRANHRPSEATARIGVVGKRRDKTKAAFFVGQ